MTKSVISLVLFAGVLSLYAEDPIKMTAKDESGHSSFTIWNVDGGGTEAPSPDHDYLDAEYVIRVPNATSVEFGGNSLQLGDATQNKSATLALSKGDNVSVSFPHDGLILSQGTIQPWFNGGAKTYTFSGTFDIRSPSTSPFKIYVGDNNSHLGMKYVFNNVIFKGDSDKAVTIWNTVDNPDGYVTLRPDASSTFTGLIILGNGSRTIKCEPKGSPTLHFGLQLTSYAQFLPPDGGTKWTLASLQLDAYSTLYTKLAGNNTSTITLTDSLSTSYPVNLTFPNARSVDSGTGYVWDVLKLPLEKKDQIHPEHFVLATQEAVGMFPDVFPSVELRVAERGDLAVLELVQRQVVQNTVADDFGYGYSKQNFEFPTSMTNAMAWSNKNLPMPTIDYVAAEHLNAATPSQCTDGAYMFPGASLTVKNSKVFCEAAHEFTIPVLRLENKAQFWPLGEQYDDATAYVKGRIHVLPTTKLDDGPIIRVRRQSTVDIEAELTGTGCLQVQPSAIDATNSVVVLDHDNSNFFGQIRIQANTYTNYDFATGQTLILKAANNVGGPLDVFTADALVVRRYSTLEVTNDLVFATANRGLTVENAQIKVGADATFTFENDITYNGSLVKVGAGRLVLGGTAQGSKKTLTVEEGTLAVSTDTALDGVAVTFAGGGALAVNPTTAGQYGMRGPFSGNLPVAFDLPADEEPYEYSDIAVCTVDASADVTPKAVRIPRHRVVFHWQDNGDDTKTLLADINRTGCAIILR